MTETAQIREIARAVDRIRPILAGRPSEMQGAILADLLALWLAGHQAEGEDATRKLRADMLAMHCFEVRRLIEVNAEILRYPDLGTTP